MIGRRTLLAAGLATAALPAFAQQQRGGFVTRDRHRLMLDGRRYRFAGANLWYGAYLAADAPFGDRARLSRELDRLQAIGATNLRVLASSELSPLKNSLRPTFRGEGASYDDALLGGLDWLLAEMAKRDMRAVLYLTNFWEWSGGMMTYLTYVNGGRFIDMNDPAHPWPAFADATARFYETPAAVRLYHHYVRALVGRTNRVTERAYADDPTIMSWQLANEPRPGGSDTMGLRTLPAFQRWVGDTAALIKTLAPSQLVSTGSEGLKGSLERAEIVRSVHADPNIDYLTCHTWPLNWTWVDAANLAGTYDAGAARVADYLDQHVRVATALGKPLVFEEFGYPRDGGSFDPTAGVTFRDRFYAQVVDASIAGAGPEGPVAGFNFWGWSGEARAAHPDFRFVRGDTKWLGDPPHEPQGWYSVFDTDRSTQALIRDAAGRLRALG
jgi:mannan endo-1,4-beta-mannosidase